MSHKEITKAVFPVGGLGTRFLPATKATPKEMLPFAVLLADDLIDGGVKGCTHQVVEQFEQTQQSIIAVQEVDHDKTDQYGIVQVSDKTAKSAKIEAIIEKPKPEVAPPNQGVVGRYILTPEIFELLGNTKEVAGGEIQLTDAISEPLKEEQVSAYKFDGIRYDCGSKAGFLEAT